MKVEGTSIIQGEGTESAAEPIGDGTSGTTTADNVYVPVLSQILTDLKNSGMTQVWQYACHSQKF